MESNKRILYLTAAYPYGIGGGSFANHAYLRAISEISGGRVDVLFAEGWDQNWDEKILLGDIYRANPRSKIGTLMSPLTGEFTRFSKPAEKILRDSIGKYCCIVSNGSSISGNLIAVARKSGVKVVTIHHNYEPEYFADNNSGLNKWLYLPWVKHLEKNAYLYSDINLFLTQQDLKKFRDVYGDTNGRCEVIGAFEYKDYEAPNIAKKSVGEELTFVITGSLCTEQGVDGVSYFFEELYQSIPDNCKVIIAGRSPSDEVIALCSRYNNVVLIPNPANMSQVIADGDIYVCPTRVGGGLKLRVMDGLSLGLPVITHACSARGYDTFYGKDCFQSFSSKEEFKAGVGNLAENIRSIKREDVISLYKESFAYASGKERMKSALNGILL